MTFPLVCNGHVWVQTILFIKPPYTEETASFCLKYKHRARGVPAPTDGKYTSPLLTSFKLSYVYVRKCIYCSIYMFFPQGSTNMELTNRLYDGRKI
jgi:hypothetical protein